MALAGLGGLSVPRGSNFGEAFISSLAGSARASGAAQQAAEAYAMKKIEAERANEERQARLGLIEAQTAKASRPEPPPKSQFGNKPWYEDPALANDPNAIAARKKATYISPPGQGRAPAKTVGQRADERIQINRQVKLQKESNALLAANDPAELFKVSYDMALEPETRKAAHAKWLRITHPTNPQQVP